jgi:hypothetical protein
MKHSAPALLRRALFLAAVFTGSGAGALSLGPDEFAAARDVTCILAQDALGYLTEEEFTTLVDEALAGYDEVDGDILYAQALGYFDGLMFGLPPGDDRQISGRLRQFNASAACRRAVADPFDS